MILTAGAELYPAVQQQPFLIIEPVISPIHALDLLQFIISQLELPGIQIESGSFQGIEAVKILPVDKDNDKSMREVYGMTYAESMMK